MTLSDKMQYYFGKKKLHCKNSSMQKYRENAAGGSGGSGGSGASNASDGFGRFLSRGFALAG
jgi:hypothetical protein